MGKQRRNRVARDRTWHHLTPEVLAIVKENVQKIKSFMETPNGEKRQPSEEGQDEEKEKGRES